MVMKLCFTCGNRGSLSL